MKGNLYTVLYAAVLGLICATALTGVDVLTREAYENNKKAKKARELMKVLGIRVDPNATAEEIVEISKSRIKRHPGRAKTLGVPMVYVSEHEDEGMLWAIEFEGDGMWKPVKGLLCLKSDMKTIYRITFYEQEETPGLGAKIAYPAQDNPFQNSFRNKSIYGPAGKPGILIKKGRGASGINEVDAITSATITSKQVQKMLNRLIEKVAKLDASVRPADREVPDGR